MILRDPDISHGKFSWASRTGYCVQRILQRVKRCLNLKLTVISYPPIDNRPTYRTVMSECIYMSILTIGLSRLLVRPVTALRPALLNEVIRASFAEDRILREKLGVRALSWDRDLKGGF